MMAWHRVYVKVGTFEATEIRIDIKLYCLIKLVQCPKTGFSKSRQKDLILSVSYLYILLLADNRYILVNFKAEMGDSLFK